MTGLLWPGDDRAGDVFDDAAVLRAMVEVESAWLAALVTNGVAPDTAKATLEPVGADDATAISRDSAASGNPVPPLVAVLRARLADHDAATWLHRGLTSQDVLDSALMCCTRDAVDRVLDALAAQVAALADLADRYRDTPMIARTLTQHAVPTTFGAKVATWLHGLLDAADDLAALRFPAQFGGAAGTRAALLELATLAAGTDPWQTVGSVTDDAAAALGLDAARPWHTSRTPVTRIGDALMRCADAWGHVANDVLLLGRPEIGELTEPSAGGSSTMPQKANPVLTVLLRRWALSAPGYGAQLHVASAATVDERADGGWHAEWQPWQLLARHTVSAAAQATQVCSGLQVHTERMRANLDSALPAALAERASMRELFAAGPGSDTDDAYPGTVAELVDAALARAGAIGGPAQ